MSFESRLDELLAAARRAADLGMTAAACGTTYTYQKAADAKDHEEELRDKFLEDLGGSK